MALMKDIEPYVQPYNWGGNDGFTTSYVRFNEKQRSEYDPVIDSINVWFQTNWSQLTNDEKMEWKYQRYMQDYLGCISSIDDNVGRILDYLDEEDLYENTIVVYTSDQGFYLGEHGWFDKRFIYDESFKTPLLIRWPNKIKPGMKKTEMVQNLDYAQTFLDMAGIDQPLDMQGESLMPLLTGEESKWNRDAVYYHYYEYPSVHMVKRHYGIVTEEYKLAHFYYDVDEWELYDRHADLNEMNNVYNDPSYSGIVSKLKIELTELRSKYNDSSELDQFYLNQYLAD
jgi:arylsulfatase A-like enzyme